MREFEAYAAVPYLGGVYPQTHPDNLATIGHILGMAAAHPAKARVLEVGCADGANLLGMAAWLPEARFVGVDGEPGQIARGEALRAAAGLDNVVLRAADLRDLSAERLGGTFDYIVVHGVFSWVAPDAQRALLRLCRDALRPQGIAYISYNALPGWHMSMPVRDLMRYHTRHLRQRGAPPDAIIRAAVEIVARLAPASPLLADYAPYLRGQEGDYLFHDYLSARNQPLSLEDFQARCTAEGLQYLGDAEPHRSLGLALPPAVQAGLDALTEDPVRREQYVDLITGRELRRSLLCHAAIQPRRDVDASVLSGLHVRSPLAPVEGGAYWQRPGDPSATLVVQTRAQQHILERLHRAYPGTIVVDSQDTAVLGWACFLRGLATVHRWTPAMLPPDAVQPGTLLRAPRLLQEQLRRGLPLTSPWLEGIALPAQGRALHAALEGVLSGERVLDAGAVPAARALARLGCLQAA